MERIGSSPNRVVRDSPCYDPRPIGGPTLPPRPSLKKSLRAIERAFADLAALAAGLADRVRVAERGAGRATTANPHRKLTITPKRRAQRKLHGSYIGHLRHLKPAQKLRVKAVKEKRGYEAAIRVAKKMGEAA